MVLIDTDGAASLAETERDLAVSDLDRREQTDDDAIRAQVRDAIEQELLDEHRAELEARAEQYIS